MDKFISIKKACKLLECNEQQLYQVINDQPRLIRNRGTGMQRKLSEYDVLEWRKRRSTIEHQLTRAVPHPTKEIKYKIIQLHPAPKIRKQRGKEVIYVQTPQEKHTEKPTEKRNSAAMKPAQKTKKNNYKSAPTIIQQGDVSFHNLARVSESIGRAQATVMDWLSKSSFRIVELADPDIKGSPKRKYIREEAVRFVTVLAEKRAPLVTQKTLARDAGQDSMELISIPAAAKIMKVKDAKVRHLVGNGKLKGYGPRKLSVKIYEVRKALLKPRKKPGPSNGPRPAPASKKTSAPQAPTPTPAPTPTTLILAPAIDTAHGSAISELDKEILNKALDMSIDMGDLSILCRVLHLLGA